MTLAASRIVFQGETPYAHEREAIAFAIDALPNSDPYHLWALLELLEPSTGRLYEIDMLVLGYSALYLIEVKSGPGVYTGDHQDWYRTAPGESRPRYMECPYRLTNHKAKVLSARLRHQMKGNRPPWIEPLIFLSHPDTTLRLSASGRTGVVTRDTFERAVQRHDYPGSDPRHLGHRIARPLMRDTAMALAALGLRPREGKTHVGAYQLGPVLHDGPGYQDRLASHRERESITRRARTYLVPQQTSIERRQQLVRAAEREVDLLWDVREHPHILRISDYVTDAPVGPTVLFDPFDEGLPLSTVLRNQPDLEFLDRVAIVEQVGRALSHCHQKGIVHGALSPEAVLVRKPTGGSIETRLFNFQLGESEKVSATTHWSDLADAPWAIYQAPELREDPTARTPQSDVFSLGALAYHVFTGQPPGETVVDVARRLATERWLDPRATDDGVQESIADLICQATTTSPVERSDDAGQWVELLVEHATLPDVAAAPIELDPLEASKGDTLGDELLVEGVLGQGATSRVLHVGRVSDGRYYALKVPLGPEQHARLEAEADALDKLRHPRIVQVIRRATYAERHCLLLSLAGSETLHRYLAREGTVSLELAERYGDDLLSALEHLEEQKVMHRDIKPANLGVGSVSKSRAHLTLFDFSLARSSRAELKVGTAAYRDPFLDLRGAWDNDAERWSAAVTLHEMLTGVRPSFDGVAIDASSKLLLAAERFDPSVRDGLVAFFERALARDTEQRFASAEEMRRAWVTALAAPLAVAVSNASAAPSEHPEAAAEDEPLTDERLAAIVPDASIESLPLSPRAKNALDRAGVLRAEDLLALPDNRLSAIRGIGRRVAQEILGFRDRWRAARALAPVEHVPFFAGYRGDDLLLHTAGVSEDAATALRDAGLRSLVAVAAAPDRQVRALATRHGFDVQALRALLDAENRSANERARPSTLEGWLEALLPKRARGMKHPRLLYGIEGTFAGQLGVSVKDLAEDQGVTAAAIYLALGKAREDWAKHGAVDELEKEAHALLDAASGALPLAEAAVHLLARVPHDRGADASILLASAAALLRVVVEIEKDEADALRYVRLGAGQPWLALSDGHARAAKALGAAADELAARPVLAGKGETERVLADAVRDTPLATVSVQRLAEIAALASEGAACSSRLEIYPRGMSAERALALSISILRGDIGADEVLRRVSLRYPDAEPLPGRPALDELLERHGLRFSESKNAYERPGAMDWTSIHTHSPLERTRTALPKQALSMEPAAIIARQFDERLRNAVERHHLRVLGVSTDRAAEAAREIGQRVGVEPVAFDRLLIRAMRARMASGGIQDDAIVHDADRAGPHGKAWPNLLRLVEAAADTVADELLPPEAPLLLVQPGLLARYRLVGFLERLVAAARDAEAPILLLVPGPDTGGIPRINGELAIPGLHPSQALFIPPEWLANRHNAPAA